MANTNKAAAAAKAAAANKAKQENVEIARTAVESINNETSKAAKQAIKSYFADYELQLKLQWDGLKQQDNAFKVLNNVIAGIAGKEGTKPEIWLIMHYSRFVTESLQPCRRRKDSAGNEYFTLATLSGNTAKGLLKAAALNCIESQRIGNHFKQVTVVAEEPRK